MKRNESFALVALTALMLAGCAGETTVNTTITNTPKQPVTSVQTTQQTQQTQQNKPASQSQQETTVPMLTVTSIPVDENGAEITVSDWGAPQTMELKVDTNKKDTTKK